MVEMSFQDILHRPIEEIRDPVPLPVGKYLCIVDGQYKFEKAGTKETDCVDFNLQPIQVVDGVDQDQLAAALNGEALRDKRIRHRMFITPDSAYRLKRFLIDDLGIAPTTLWQMLSETPGKEVIVKITHQPSKNKNSTTVYANVESTEKVS
jgi:hypothetical protein